MLVNTAEARFRKGLEALDAGRGIEALALFEAAIEIERRYGSSRPQARYLSFYGLCLALESGRIREGSEFCRQAIALEFYNADLYWNLGRVMLSGGRRRDAWDILRKGLALQPGHMGLRREMARMGFRRRPLIPFLSRRHPLNVLLGRLAGSPRKAPARAAGTTPA